MSERSRDWLWCFVVGVLSILALVFLACGLTRAEWKPEYAQADSAVRDWYAHAELTEAAQKRFLFKICCAHADVVHTKFRVGVKGADVWEFFDNDATPPAWRKIPDDIIHWGETAPDGRPTLFRLGAGGALTCFWPGEGGL